MGDWNSKQYLKFEGQRTRPSVDLIRNIPVLNPRNILDVGCGPGNSTAELYKNFPKSKIVGIDSSEDMLMRAEAAYPNLKFLKCSVPNELERIEEKFDIIYSNACIHWIPNQELLLKALMDKLAAGGALAVQIPVIQKAPFYEMLGKVLTQDKWRDKLGGIKNFHNLLPEEYYDILSGLTDNFELWETVYYHKVSDFGDIIEWYKGSGLRPYLEALSVNERAEFESDILSRIKQMYNRQADGNIILKMPRLFFVAQKIK